MFYFDKQEDCFQAYVLFFMVRFVGCGVVLTAKSNPELSEGLISQSADLSDWSKDLPLAENSFLEHTEVICQDLLEI